MEPRCTALERIRKPGRLTLGIAISTVTHLEGMRRSVRPIDEAPDELVRDVPLGSSPRQVAA